MGGKLFSGDAYQFRSVKKKVESKQLTLERISPPVQDGRNKCMRYLIFWVCVVILIIVCSFNVASAYAAGRNSTHSLPLSTAIDAAAEAIRTCETKGWNVTAIVVNAEGIVKAHLKGDRSTIHTKDTAFRKAYTVVTLGPIFNIETTKAFAQLVAKSDNPIAYNNIPETTTLAGGVAIKVKGEIVAGLGVGGAPGGDKDEFCAQAGIEKIRNHLQRQ
jgi:uncharacterized protein GlcG (DUF336 family)